MTSLARALSPAPDTRPAARAGTPELFVGSEVGPLRRVIVHRPGAELRRLTPENTLELLFDDLVWVERAAEEHDVLTSALAARGVEVLYLDELLAQTLAIPEARGWLLRETLRLAEPGPTLARALSEWLAGLDAADLAARLIGGITHEELPFRSLSLLAQMGPPDAFVLTPLPNHMFTRDASAWAYTGVSLHAMAKPARRREALHFEAVYRHHPRFAPAEYEVWSDGMPAAPALEGGDILVLGRGSLLVGVGERTSPAAVEAYAQRLFAAGAAARLIAVVLPAARATIHLDAVLTMVDADAFTVSPPLRAKLDAYTLLPARHGVQARHTPDLFAAIARALELPRVRIIESDSDHETLRREQWSHGNNLLAIAPGVVVAYERNTETNARLRDHGLEVIPVPGSELTRGRGGPRCLTCPIERDSID
jgi:arginine deiminase